MTENQVAYVSREGPIIMIMETGILVPLWISETSHRTNWMFFMNGGVAGHLQIVPAMNYKKIDLDTVLPYFY